MQQKPVLTTAAVIVTAVAAIVQYTAPAVVPVLERGPLDTGEWWRLVTPLLVQTLGWYQVVTNLVTLAFVGAVAEPLLGRWQWVVLFVAGSVGGQVAAYAWHEPGGGDSIAICGLAGGVVVRLLAGGTGESPWPTRVVVGYVAALTGWGFLGIPGAAVAVVVAAVVLVVAPRLALVGSVVCAVLLAVASDLHGVSLVSGLVVGAVLTGLAARRPAHDVR